MDEYTRRVLKNLKMTKNLILVDVHVAACKTISVRCHSSCTYVTLVIFIAWDCRCQNKDDWFLSRYWIEADTDNIRQVIDITKVLKINTTHKTLLHPKNCHSHADLILVIFCMRSPIAHYRQKILRQGCESRRTDAVINKKLDLISVISVRLIVRSPISL